MPKMRFFMKPHVLANRKALKLHQEPSRSRLTAQSVRTSVNPEEKKSKIRQKKKTHPEYLKNQKNKNMEGCLVIISKPPC